MRRVTGCVGYVDYLSSSQTTTPDLREKVVKTLVFVMFEKRLTDTKKSPGNLAASWFLKKFVDADRMYSQEVFSFPATDHQLE